MNTRLSRRINGERLILLGWSRAILMQMAHPLIAAGVIEHSSFRASPAAAVRRLRATVRAMLRLLFGDDETHARTVQAILAIHRRVRGTLTHAVGPFPAGTPYSAEDPALVLWVHATLIESTVLAFEAIVRPLSPDERDVYCDESATVARELGARPDDIPRTWADLSRYMDGVHASDVLTVGDDAREIARALLSGPLARYTGPVAWANRLLTTNWLPPRLRDAYALSWDHVQERRAARLLGLCRRVRRSLPGIVARWRHAPVR